MERKHSFIYFLLAFANGLTVPFISLICLSHGATLTNLSLVISVFAITVILIEVPSGMISDMLGRKYIFVMSQFILTLCYVCILFSKSWLWLIAAYVLKGIGIAFYSGSLEALIVEEHVACKGKEAMAEANSLLLRLDCIGAALGALAGGMIGSLGDNYTVLLLLRIGLGLFIAISSYFCIKESVSSKRSAEKRITVFNQIELMRSTIKESDVVGIMMLVAFFYGSVVAMMETYWQQDLLILLSHEFQWIFGIVSCLGYAGAILGGRAGVQFGESSKKDQIYGILRISLPVSIALLGFSTRWYIFILLYFMVYYIIGVGDLLERNMLHGAVPNECRASMLSLYSLFIRGGGAMSAFISSGIVAMIGVNAIWAIVPGFVMMAYLVLFGIRKNR